MTITRTEERPAHREESEWIPPDAASAAPPVQTGSPPRVAVATQPPQTWTEVEEEEPPRPRTDWTTRFAWAKTVGGW